MAVGDDAEVGCEIQEGEGSKEQAEEEAPTDDEVVEPVLPHEHVEYHEDEDDAPLIPPEENASDQGKGTESTKAETKAETGIAEPIKPPPDPPVEPPPDQPVDPASATVSKPHPSIPVPSGERLSPVGVDVELDSDEEINRKHKAEGKAPVKPKGTHQDRTYIDIAAYY